MIFPSPKPIANNKQKLVIGAQVQIKDDSVTCVTNFTHSFAEKNRLPKEIGNHSTRCLTSPSKIPDSL